MKSLFTRSWSKQHSRVCLFFTASFQFHTSPSCISDQHSCGCSPHRHHSQSHMTRCFALLVSLLAPRSASTSHKSLALHESLAPSQSFLLPHCREFLSCLLNLATLAPREFAYLSRVPSLNEHSDQCWLCLKTSRSSTSSQLAEVGGRVRPLCFFISLSCVLIVLPAFGYAHVLPAVGYAHVLPDVGYAHSVLLIFSCCWACCSRGHRTVLLPSFFSPLIWAVVSSLLPLTSACGSVSVLCLASPPPALLCGSLLLRSSPHAAPTPLLSIAPFVIVGSR